MIGKVYEGLKEHAREQKKIKKAYRSAHSEI